MFWGPRCSASEEVTALSRPAVDSNPLALPVSKGKLNSLAIYFYCPAAFITSVHHATISSRSVTRAVDLRRPFFT